MEQIKLKKPIKLLSLDLDGTSVLDDDTMSDAVKVAINKAKQKGVHIVFNTGRWLNLSKHHIFAIDKDHIQITCNGAILVNGHEEVIHRQCLNMHQAHQLIKLLEEHKVPYGVANETTMYATSFSRKSHPLYHKNCQEKNNFDDLTYISKITYRTHNPIVNSFTNLFSQIEIAGSTEHEFFETWSKFTSKGIAMAQIASYYNIDIGTTMAIGDSYNDIPMLKLAGLGVAMGQACTEVKQIADVIAPTMQEDGVAWTIKEFILNE